MWKDTNGKLHLIVDDNCCKFAFENHLMKKNILIVEDEELYASKLEMLVEIVGHNVLEVVDNSQDALAIVNEKTPDLILMDINIQGDHDGIELADLIHQKKEIPILFISSLKDDSTFRRVSRTQPVGFLLKPFDELQLQRSIDLIISQLPEKAPEKREEDWETGSFNKDFFFVKNRQQLEKVHLENILYLEADGRYTILQTDRKKYLIRIPLSELIAKLPTINFAKTHRSFIVNITKITSVDLQDNVIWLGDKMVPVSRREKEDFLKKIDWI